MKKSTLSVLVLIIIVIVGIVWFGKKDNNSTNQPNNSNNPIETTTPVPVIEKTKVSSKLSKFENAELGFAVNYPSYWEVENGNSGVSFVIPIDKNQVSTVAKLESKVNVISGKCAFPPVTTIKDRGVMKVGQENANTISMSNTVQGRNYFDRMYSIQKGNICYMFAFSSITLSPESKGLTGSNIIQAQNNNKALINTTDTEFTEMVKSFVFVQGPAGQDETKVPVR